MNEGKFILSEMDLDEISLVPSGDDPLAKVVIAKADTAIAVDEEEDDEVKPSTNLKRKKRGKRPSRLMRDKMITKDDHSIVDGDSDTLTSALKEHQLKEKYMAGEIDKSSLTPEQVSYIEELEEFAELVDESLENGTLVKAAAQEDEVLSKADPELAEYISKQDAKLVEMEERIAKADARESQRVAIEKEAQYPNMDQEAVAEILLELPAELVEKVEKVLSAANIAANNTAAFVEVGKNFFAEDSDISAEVKAKVEKTDGLTSEQALEELLSSDPSRYDALMQEVGN